jgi:hypothetical protein
MHQRQLQWALRCVTCCAQLTSDACGCWSAFARVLTLFGAVLLLSAQLSSAYVVQILFFFSNLIHVNFMFSVMFLAESTSKLPRWWSNDRRWPVILTHGRHVIFLWRQRVVGLMKRRRKTLSSPEINARDLRILLCCVGVQRRFEALDRSKGFSSQNYVQD